MVIKIAVNVLVRKGSLLAMIKRNKQNAWSVPGGHLEYGEHIVDAGLREVKEEVGLDVSPKQILGYTEHVFPEKDIHYLMFWIEADVDKGSLQNLEPDRVDEVAWVSYEALPADLFNPFRKFLTEYSYKW